MKHFSFDELCALAELPRRTVRYYIQIGLVDRPEGGGRGAYYTGIHLEQLLAVRRWQRNGLSLERIGELMRDETGSNPPEKPRGPGTVEVWTHIVIDDGIELTLEPGRAGLSPEAVRRLAGDLKTLYHNIRSEP